MIGTVFFITQIVKTIAQDLEDREFEQIAQEVLRTYNFLSKPLRERSILVTYEFNLTKEIQNETRTYLFINGEEIFKTYGLKGRIDFLLKDYGNVEAMTLMNIT